MARTLAVDPSVPPDSPTASDTYTPTEGTMLVDGCELDVDDVEDTEPELRECGCTVEDTEECTECSDHGCGDTCIGCCTVDHCPNCGRDRETYDECNDSAQCSYCCSCYTCDSCGNHYNNDELSGCIDCYMCSTCGCSCDSEDDDGEYQEGFTIKQAPWVMRGIDIIETSVTWKEPWNTLWPGVDQKLDPVQAMADFYLLEVTGSGILNSVHPVTHNDPLCREIMGEANRLFNQLVERLDVIFCEYVDMVVGGEVRHHQATGSLRRERSEAWSLWRELRDAGGTQVLLDAVDLFRDIPKGGIGGEAWATPAQLLHDRLTGKLTKRDWVDRAFTLEHNNGCLFNKITWGCTNPPEWPIHAMAGSIGPAHAADPTDWGPLLAAASPDTCSLFRRWWQQTNVLRRLHGLEITKIPTIHDDVRWVGVRQLSGSYMEFRTGAVWSEYHLLDRWRDGDSRWASWLPDTAQGKALCALIWRMDNDTHVTSGIYQQQANYWTASRIPGIGKNTILQLAARTGWGLADMIPVMMGLLRLYTLEADVDTWCEGGEPQLGWAAKKLVNALMAHGRTVPPWLVELANSAEGMIEEPVDVDDEQDDEQDDYFEVVESCPCEMCAALKAKQHKKKLAKELAEMHSKQAFATPNLDAFLNAPAGYQIQTMPDDSLYAVSSSSFANKYVAHLNTDDWVYPANKEST